MLPIVSTKRSIKLIIESHKSHFIKKAKKKKESYWMEEEGKAWDDVRELNLMSE